MTFIDGRQSVFLFRPATRLSRSPARARTEGISTPAATVPNRSASRDHQASCAASRRVSSDDQCVRLFREPWVSIVGKKSTTTADGRAPESMARLSR